jgi:hypothetical protein
MLVKLHNFMAALLHSLITIAGHFMNSIKAVFVVSCIYSVFAQNLYAAPAAGVSPPNKTEGIKKPVKSNWQYKQQEDKMGRGKIKTATIKSVNKVEFDFPYEGAQRATLQLRSHPEYGLDLILSIEKGQFVCGVYDCPVEIKFDDAKAEKYGGSLPDDNSSDTLFLTNQTFFVDSAKKSKKILIEASFYREGSVVFTFDSAGLEW